MIEEIIGIRRVYVYRGVCDMRRSFNRLSMMVADQMEQDPQSGSVYIFFNRGMNRIKALCWDRDGYVIWHKRLEIGQYQMPGGQSIEVDRMQWMHMLEGVEVKILKREKRYKKR